MAVGQLIYNTFFKKTSSFVLTIAVGVFIFERTLDIGTEYLFDELNRGKQWKDIKHKYEK